jgi:glycosyltransferase involved in cell wall biosynthesis
MPHKFRTEPISGGTARYLQSTRSALALSRTPLLQQTTGYCKSSIPQIVANNLKNEQSVTQQTVDRSERQTRDGACEFKPIRIGFVVGTFSFGGSETETIELVYGADSRLIEFSGIAACTPQPLPEGEPPKDGSFPPIYAPASSHFDRTDPRVKVVNHFREAVEAITRTSDIVITWGVPNLYEYLPAGRLPKLVILSKDSGTWASHFLYYNSMLTHYYAGNSTIAASAFPEPLRSLVEVIHNGVNPVRVRPRLSRSRQRKLWGFTERDKIVGYLGRIERDKGIRKTVEAIAELPREWKGVFIGVNPNSRYAGELAKECERVIPSRYRLLPWTHDVGSALVAFDVFCHPSEHEGFSNSISEAWLAGVPTVYTRDTGVLPDLGELGVGVSPYANGTEIAEAILDACGNEDLVARARHVISSNYLTPHNISRWTEYLIDLGRLPPKRRALLILPTDMKIRPEGWVDAFDALEIDLEVCGIAKEDRNSNSVAWTELGFHPRYHCPYCIVTSPSEVNTLIAYTHPDLVLTFSTPTIGHLLSGGAMDRTIMLPNISDESALSSDLWRGRLAKLIVGCVLE